MPRRAAGLTAARARTAKPGRYGDGGGLYLLVRDPEARFWLFRYAMTGAKIHEMGLGAAAGPGAVTLPGDQVAGKNPNPPDAEARTNFRKATAGGRAGATRPATGAAHGCRSASGGSLGARRGLARAGEAPRSGKWSAAGPPRKDGWL